jgi:hypothetical protein
MINDRQLAQSQQFDLEKMSAPAKFRMVAAYRRATDNDYGIGFIKDSPRGPLVVIADLDRNDFTTIRTRNSEKSYEQVMSEFIPIPEFRFMLYQIARAYTAHEAIMLEGGTAIGKTYAVNALGYLLYGPKTVLPEVYCHGQTDVSELMGKPVPAGLSNNQLVTIEEFLRSPEGIAMRAEMLAEEGKVDITELTLRVALKFNYPAQRGSFRLQRGKLPLAMTGDIAPDGSFIELPNGPGVPFHIQELGTAPALVTNSLLRMRGTKGMFAGRIQLGELDGAVVESGDSFGLIMSTNPPGKGFKDRFPVDQANARGLVWINLPEALTHDSLKLSAKHIFSCQKIARDASAPGAILDLRKYPELGAMLGEVVANFHEQHTQLLAAGEGSRQQKIPVTMDHMWKVARFLQHQQQDDVSNDMIDLVATLKKAILTHYIFLLEGKPSIVGKKVQVGAAPTVQSASPGTTQQPKRSAGESLLNHLQQALSNADFNPVIFDGKQTSYADAITALTREAWEQELAEERSSQGHAASDQARLQIQGAKIHANLGSCKKRLSEEQFHTYLEQLKRDASPEAYAVIQAWEASQGGV